MFCLQVGDEILQVNGKQFDRLTHDEAVNVLKSSHRLTFLVRYIGKVPHSSLVPNRVVANSSSLGTAPTTTNSQSSWAKPSHVSSSDSAYFFTREIEEACGSWNQNRFSA